MRFFTLIGTVALLVGQAFASGLNFAVGHSNTTEVDMLKPALQALQQDTVGPNNCSTSCTSLQTNLTNCNGNFGCVCTDDIGNALFDCESCLYNALITNNVPPSDPLVGSQALLTAFGTTCKLNVSVLLQVPDGWNGPKALHLNTAETVLGVIVASFLGLTSIYLLFNIE